MMSQRGIHQYRQRIPVSLTVKQFDEFVLPHLTIGKRGPAPRMSLFNSFSYVSINIYNYVYDRVTKKFEMPSLANLIAEKFSLENCPA